MEEFAIYSCENLIMGFTIKLEKGFQKNQYLRLQIVQYSYQTSVLRSLVVRALERYESRWRCMFFTLVVLVSCFGLECLDFEESSYNQLPGSLSPDYKYLHANHT